MYIQESILRLFDLPFGMAIDGAGNILLCNSNSRNIIIIVNTNGKIVHKINTTRNKSLGIAVDSTGRIITVDLLISINIY